MRYSLRNKKKIAKAFGKTELTTLINDLDLFFESNKVVNDYVDDSTKEKYPILNISFDKGRIPRFASFNVISTKFDVYNLALRVNK
ncbi:MAG: hypothetical protein WCS51_05530 [Bacilli bacterium]